MYRKIKKKKKKRDDEKAEKLLWETNPELAREKQEAEERKRIKLRMTQKHRQTSAWMKKTLKRGGGATKGSKEAVLEQLQEREKLHRAIMNRPEQQQDDEEEEEDENMTDVDKVKSLMTEIQSDSDAMKKKDKGLFGMKFMQNSMEKQRLAALENAKALLRDLEGTATKKIWYHQLNPDRNLGKTNPLNDNDLQEFVEQQKRRTDGPNSWTFDINDIDTDAYDLTVRNPNAEGPEELGTPTEILAELRAPDQSSEDILQRLEEMLG